MRQAMWLGLLALAACNENSGWNPNYVIADRPYGAVLDSTTPYAAYKYEREWALLGQREVPETIPRALPLDAPTPADIRGPSVWQTIRGEAVAVVAGPVLPEVWRQPAQPVVAAPAVIPAPPSAPAAAVVAVPVAPVAVEPVAITPGPYPGASPVLIRYAQAAGHERGTAVWPRPNADPRIAARTCRTFADADSAQIAFLVRGGPEVDPAQMDPDGDGFVCGWNPAPFRQGAL
ncbi:hypothetical protein GI374_06365 [Paracoccus sp. S-4012]|uniref:hypothetical protein n=1 Tax=Paracoccus sp. S-4012 TaxID=2665648 RepID=UPI0012B01EDE|nr:hypothetical protein [Paracoccus sp. S-4012]MRX50081.1 hypothetical protein [Paracoccus sp. S-4012]